MTDSDNSVRYTIDRREGKVCVLVDEEARSIDVLATNLPGDCRREGTVLEVPVDDKGQPDWAHAWRNHAEEERLLADAKERLARLRRTPPGDDVQL